MDVPNVRDGAREAPVTKRDLFDALCAVADALQDECVRVDFSPHKLALEAIVERVDVLIDQILEDGVQDDGPPRRPGEGRWTLPKRPEESVC